MKALSLYTASVVGFATAMALHAYGEPNARTRQGKFRTISASPVWPVYVVFATYAIASKKSPYLNSPIGETQSKGR